MNRAFNLSSALVMALVFSGTGGAQTHGAAASTAASSGVASPRPVQAAHAPGMVRTHTASSGGVHVIQIAPSGEAEHSTHRMFTAGRGGREDSQFAGVPGLGFDYAHLAATRGNVRSAPSSFEFSDLGGRELRNSNSFSSFTPIFYGGIPYALDTSEYEQVPQQPQVIVLQQPPPTVTVQQAPAEQFSSDVLPRAISGARPFHPDTAGFAGPAPVQTQVAPASSPAPNTSALGLGEYILVQRDGRVLFATAYSVIGGDIRYITPEGNRRTVALSELDAEASRTMNDARGTTLYLQN